MKIMSAELVDSSLSLSHALKPVEAPLQSTKSDELVSRPILLCQSRDRLACDAIPPCR